MANNVLGDIFEGIGTAVSQTVKQGAQDLTIGIAETAKKQIVGNQNQNDFVNQEKRQAAQAKKRLPGLTASDSRSAAMRITEIRNQLASRGTQAPSSPKPEKFLPGKTPGSGGKPSQFGSSVAVKQGQAETKGMVVG